MADLLGRFPSSHRGNKQESSANNAMSEDEKTVGQNLGISNTARRVRQLQIDPLHEQFHVFSQFGSRVDGKHIAFYNLEKWLKQAGIIDGRRITSAYLAILYKGMFKSARLINFEQTMILVEELTKSRDLDVDTVQDKLVKCGPPRLSSTVVIQHLDSLCTICIMCVGNAKYVKGK